MKTGNIHACGDSCNQTNTNIPRLGQRVCPLTNLILGDVLVHDKEDWQRGMRPNYTAQGLLEDGGGGGSGYDYDQEREHDHDQDHEYDQEQDAMHEEEELHKHLLTHKQQQYEQKNKQKQKQQEHQEQQLLLENRNQINGRYLLEYGERPREDRQIQLQPHTQQQQQTALVNFRELKAPTMTTTTAPPRWTLPRPAWQRNVWTSCVWKEELPV